MKKYKVHLFAVVRVPVEVEAESQTEAIKKAEEETDLHALFDYWNPGGIGQERQYAEEITEYLVDEQGDQDHSNTRCYEYEGGELREKPNIALTIPRTVLDSLQELSAWMRLHTGPKDGTKEMLTRAVIAIEAAGEKPRDIWE